MNEIIEIGTAVFVLTIARVVIYAVERIARKRSTTLPCQ